MPEISVVMSVHNGGATLERTIKSVVNQTIGDIELIIVDDGSTDGTSGVLAAYANNDSRIRVLSKENEGLTASLNIGCELASSPIIARQDVGDVSLPGRLEKQLDYLKRNNSVVAVGCGTRRVTEAGEFLGEIIRDLTPTEVTRQLTETGVGILHPGSMFRKDAFKKVGVYREQFRYTQDTDLWLRLSEVGLIAECPEVLLELTIDDHGISATRINQQRRLWKIARECYLARQLGESEAKLLAEAEKASNSVPPTLSAKQKKFQQRRAQYFIGGQLLEQNNAACRKYLMRSLLDRHLFLPSLIKLGQSVFCKTHSNDRHSVKC